VAAPLNATSLDSGVRKRLTELVGGMELAEVKERVVGGAEATPENGLEEDPRFHRPDSTHGRVFHRPSWAGSSP
jgi:hypothetical protein